MTASEAGGNVHRAPRTPNVVLRGIRESERNESRNEFAEAMARLAREMGVEVYPDGKYVQRLESGDITWPHRTYRTILERLCDRSASELGFAPSARSAGNSTGDSGELPSRVNVKLREAVWESGMERAEFARKIGIDPKTVERWITRGVVPQPARRWKASLILGLDESELWPDATAHQETGQGTAILARFSSEARQEYYPVSAGTDFLDLGQFEMLRRQMNDALSQGAMSDASLNDWERSVIRYGRATRNRPASILLTDISADLTELTRLLEQRHAASAVRRLTRVSAQMSGLMCLIFCLLDNRSAFRNWARTATAAANEAGDPETLSWIMAQIAHGHYYSGDVHEAVEVARSAYEVTRIPCAGKALAAALEARGQAIIGNKPATHEALSRAEDILSQLTGEALTPSAFGYNEASLRFHEGNAYTHLRDVKHALKAQDKALALCGQDNYSDWAMTRLDRAQCLIYQGDASGGLEYATETMTTLSGIQRQGIITLRGQAILADLPASERTLVRARDLQEVLMLTSGESGNPQ